MDTPQVSGKVFRFLSAMHPSLSKSERKRYAGFDPDKWYPWTAEVSAEFMDLMRRSPRDTSFARGFAYVAQRAVPEGGYIPTGTLLENLNRLPAAYRSSQGTGYDASIDRAGHASIRYSGMPGFNNACIAIQGELTQRLQASGAQSVVVKHTAVCRVNGGEVCEFEIEWAGESVPSGATPVSVAELVGENGASPPQPEPVEETTAVPPPPAASPAEAPLPQAATAVAPAPAASAAAGAPANGLSASDAGLTVALESADAASGTDLFDQLRKRLAEADRQARLYNDSQAEIDRLRVELSRVKAQADADVAQARQQRDEACEATAELKRRIRAIVADD